MLAGGTPPPQTDRLKPPNALASVYRTADDRWIILAFVNEEKEVPLFLRALGHPEAAADPRFVDSASRHAHSADIVGLLDAEFATWLLAQWREILTSAGLTYGVVQTLDEIARDPQLLANQILVPIDDGSAEPHLTIDTPVRLDQAQKVRPRPAPHLGEHTDIVLHELGFDAAAIAKLRASGAIPQIQPEPKAA